MKFIEINSRHIYGFGGNNKGNDSSKRACHIDLIGMKVEKIPRMRIGRIAFGLTAHKGNIYIVGGK